MAHAKYLNEYKPNPVLIETAIPARLDRLLWGRFHTLVVVALGITWILDGLEVTLAGAVAGALKESKVDRRRKPETYQDNFPANGGPFFDSATFKAGRRGEATGRSDSWRAPLHISDVRRLTPVSCDDSSFSL